MELSNYSRVYLNENALEKIPETTKLLNSFAEKLKKKGIKNYLLIADDPKHPLGGASNVSVNNTKINSPIPMLDKKFKEWKLKQGISIEHDWRKDGNKNLNKGLR